MPSPEDLPPTQGILADTNRSQSAAKVATILVLVEDTPGIRLGDLASRLKTSKTSTHRLAQTLVETGLLRKTGDNQGYLLGYRLIGLGRAAEDAVILRDAAIDEMKKLRAELNETVHLAVLDDTKPVYVEKIESSQPVRHWTQLGTPIALHAGSAGKCLAYFAMSESELVERMGPDPLRRFTPETLVSLAALLADRETSLQAGYVLSIEEYYQGVQGVAVPIYTNPGVATAALSVAGPSTRVRKGELIRWIPYLLTAKHEIERVFND